jgi:hypothetical protein
MRKVQKQIRGGVSSVLGLLIGYAVDGNDSDFHGRRRWIGEMLAGPRKQGEQKIEW